MACLQAEISVRIFNLPGQDTPIPAELVGDVPKMAASENRHELAEQ